MARARAQTKAAATTASKSPKRGPDTSPSKSNAAPDPKKSKQSPRPLSKDKSTTNQAEPNSSPSQIIHRLLTSHPTLPFPLTHPSLPSLPSLPSPATQTLLALILHALLSSARISHTLAARATAAVMDAGYHDLKVLKKSTFEERCRVLTQGGYARYREKAAGELAGVAEWLEAQYDGDLNNLIEKANGKAGRLRELLKEVKGIGEVGVDIFVDTAQGVVPELAPFLDPRSRQTAERIGLGGDVQRLFELVGRDPLEMCRLAGALTSVRLGKAEGGFFEVRRRGLY